jgi:hypothetical protein
MDALDAFTSYLAQAHGCRSIAALDRSEPAPTDPAWVGLAGGARGRVAGAWSAIDDDPAPIRAPLRTSELAHALLDCRLEAPGSSSVAKRLELVRRALDAAPAGVVVFESVHGSRPAALEAARRALEEHLLTPAFIGLVHDSDRVVDHETVAAVLDREGAPLRLPGGPPADFRVVAIIPTYNEEDVIAQTLSDLVGQGIEVYLVDNWSTDATLERARPFLGRGLLEIERFPPTGPARSYDLRVLLGRIEVVAEALDWASWVMLHDADERRRSPWPGIGLREALWRVDRSGFSCVDHVTLNFWPTDDSFDPDGPDLEQQFRHFEFSDHPGHFHQRRAWKHLGQGVALSPSAGHDVDFPGRRVYPYKFLLKHYPIRSQAHGERKLLERRRRWNAEERALGWHRQYDGFTSHRFIREPSTLRRFDPATFHQEFLIERLSAAGIFQKPPSWATPPRW